MPQVVLFKTKNEVNGFDAYHDSFAQAGFEARYIPVLQETFHTDELIQFISEKKNWGGVVVSSKRGAEGWIQAIQGCKDHSSVINFNDVQLFTVGSTSLDRLSEMNPILPKRLQLDTSRAIQAKSASALLPLILQACSSDTQPLLLVRGDKSTNELQEGLKKAQRAYIETTVYYTTGRPTLESDVEALSREIRDMKEDIWLAFFSPSSAEMALSYLSSPTDPPRSGILARVRIAAIGETTSQFLMEYGLKVHAVATEPTAEGLVNAILTFSQA